MEWKRGENITEGVRLLCHGRILLVFRFRFPNLQPPGSGMTPRGIRALAWVRGGPLAAWNDAWCAALPLSAAENELRYRAKKFGVERK